MINHCSRKPAREKLVSADSDFVSPAGPRSVEQTSASTQRRDAKGRFVRSETVKRDFMRMTRFPKGRPGYIVDHIIPLACGGLDATSNMQWQSVAAAKAKDATERQGLSQLGKTCDEGDGLQLKVWAPLWQVADRPTRRTRGPLP